MEQQDTAVPDLVERDPDDIFFRPSEFRKDVVLAVWEKAEDGPEPNTKLDWRTGKVVGPWVPGESRDGIWDMGHIVPWHKVVDRLQYNNSRRLPENKMTRDEVIDEFNDISNLGVEDPETNRALGINSTRQKVERLEGVAEEAVLFADLPPEKQIVKAATYRETVAQKKQALDAKLTAEREPMSDKDNKTESLEIELPKRVIVWDTETTGFHPDPKSGDMHYIVEIAAVELVDGKPTGREFHQYIKPPRSVPPGAVRVHGLDDEFLADKPPFGDIAKDFIDFIGDSPLVAHNASFDMRFINSELARNGHDIIGSERKIDSLRLARNLLPDLEDHDLDHLAKHYKVDTSERDEHHGGLIDTRILAKVYAKLAEEAKLRNMPLFGGELVGLDTEPAIVFPSQLANQLLKAASQRTDAVLVDEANLQASKLCRYENAQAPLLRGEGETAEQGHAARVANDRGGDVGLSA